MNPRYFAALTKQDQDGKTIGKTAEEQAQRWLTANTMRRHSKGQEIVVMHDGQRSLWNVSHEYQKDWVTVEVLDLLHAQSRIWSAAKIIKAKPEVDPVVIPLSFQGSSYFRGNYVKLFPDLGDCCEFWNNFLFNLAITSSTKGLCPLCQLNGFDANQQIANQKH